jgi:hypothetical protein
MADRRSCLPALPHAINGWAFGSSLLRTGWRNFVAETGVELPG